MHCGKAHRPARKGLKELLNISESLLFPKAENEKGVGVRTVAARIRAAANQGKPGMKSRAKGLLTKCVISSWFLKPFGGTTATRNGLQNEKNVLEDVPRYWEEHGKGIISHTQTAYRRRVDRRIHRCDCFNIRRDGGSS